MKKLVVSLVFLLVAGVVVSTAVAQTGPRSSDLRNDLVHEDNRAGGHRIQAKYVWQEGPTNDLNENPYQIDEPFTPEGRGDRVTTSMASSQGHLSLGSQAISIDSIGPGAVFSAPRGMGRASSSHQNARRGINRVIKQLG